GFIFHDFNLVLHQGGRIKAAAPFSTNEQTESDNTSNFPPFFAYSTDPKLDYTEYDLLSPLLSLNRSGQQYRWHLLQLISWSGALEIVPGHDRGFLMAFLYMNETNQIGTTNVQWEQASIPLYHFMRSPNRDSTSVIWPFFSKIDDRERKYQEWQAPWPFVVIA